MVNPVSEVPEIIKIHDIFDSATSKWIGNTTHIIAYLFNLFPGSIVKYELCSSLSS